MEFIAEQNLVAKNHKSLINIDPDNSVGTTLMNE